MCVAFGGQGVYDFTRETIQCMAERRKGGETGVVAVQGLKGENVWAEAAGEGLGRGRLRHGPVRGVPCAGARLVSQPTGTSHRPPDARADEGTREGAVAAPRSSTLDGLGSHDAALERAGEGLHVHGAARRAEMDPLSVLFHLPPTPSVTYSAARSCRRRKKCS